MKDALVSKPAPVEQLRLGLGVAVIAGMALACLATLAVGWVRLEGPIRQYPNSTAVGLPKFITPSPRHARCPSWALIVDSRYSTSDAADRVMTWYQEARRLYVNQQPGASARRLSTRYEWGPVRFEMQRTVAISVDGKVTHIYITTNMKMKLCP